MSPARTALAMAAVLVFASCTPKVTVTDVASGPSVATIEMREFTFDHGAIPGGRVVFQVHNRGQTAHRLSLIPLDADMPPILDQLRGDERRMVDTQAAVPDTAPGGSGTFAVDLFPGRYAMVCFLVEADGASHALQGMATEFRIG